MGKPIDICVCADEGVFRQTKYTFDKKFVTLPKLSVQLTFITAV